MQVLEQSATRRVILYLTLIATAGAAGYYQGKGRKEIQIVEKKGEVITRVVNHTVTVTRTVHPDGTIEEKTTTKDQTKDKDTKTVDTDTATKPAGTNYSLGVRYRVSSVPSLLTPGPQNLEAEAARRLLGPFWITAGGGLGGITLGVRYDF